MSTQAPLRNDCLIDLTLYVSPKLKKKYKLECATTVEYLRRKRKRRRVSDRCHI